MKASTHRACTTMEPRATRIGRYQILEPLGRGAMGIVYKAQDPSIQRLVAIKTISQLATDPDSTQQFRTRLAIEAQAAGRLSHPHIVTIYDVGETEDDRTPYVVMEYLAGPSLQKKLSASGGKLLWQEALQLACGLARALHYAHAQGIIHRDIKPSNILFTEDGIPKIADFGIARLNLSEATLPGHVLGTPAYMSPEQLNGEPIDGRSDLFSLGVMLYAMLTGHRPFQGNSAMTVSYKVVHGDPVPVSALDCALPPNIDYVLTRLLAKHPSDRYSDGEELALDLDDLLAAQPPRSRSGIFLAPNPTQSSSSLRAARTSVTSAMRHSTAPVLTSARARRHSFWTQNRAMIAIAGTFCILFSGVLLLRHRFVSQPSASAAPASAPLDNPIATAPPGPAAAPVILNSSATASSPVSATPSPAPRRPSAARSAIPSALTLEIHHHFVDAKLSLWVDDRLAFSTPLRGENRKHLLVFNSVKGFESAVLPIPDGSHRLRIRVTADTYDQSTSLTSTFSSHREQVLRITCTTAPPKLHAAFN